MFAVWWPGGVGVPGIEGVGFAYVKPASPWTAGLSAWCADHMRMRKPQNSMAESTAIRNIATTLNLATLMCAAYQI